MKVCDDCSAKVEPGWEYCHTCGATAASPVYAVRDPFDPVVAGPADAGSAFMALLEGRPTAPAGQVFHDGEPHPGAAPLVEVITTTAPPAATPPASTPVPPLTAHVLPVHRRNLPPVVQRVATASVVVALVAVTGLLLKTRSELVHTREQLATVQQDAPAR